MSRAVRQPLKALRRNVFLRNVIGRAQQREKDPRTKACGDTMDFALLVCDEMRCALQGRINETLEPVDDTDIPF